MRRRSLKTFQLDWLEGLKISKVFETTLKKRLDGNIIFAEFWLGHATHALEYMLATHSHFFILQLYVSWGQIYNSMSILRGQIWLIIDLQSKRFWIQYW